MFSLRPAAAAVAWLVQCNSDVREDGREFLEQPALGCERVCAPLLANFSQPRDIVCSHHDDGNVGEAAVKLRGDFQSVQLRQLKVHEHQVRVQFLNNGKGLKSAPGAGNKLNFRIIFKQGTERAQESGRVVNNQNPNLPGCNVQHSRYPFFALKSKYPTATALNGCCLPVGAGSRLLARCSLFETA
jgi:hypothetical protein